MEATAEGHIFTFQKMFRDPMSAEEERALQECLWRALVAHRAKLGLCKACLGAIPPEEESRLHRRRREDDKRSDRHIFDQLSKVD